MADVHTQHCNRADSETEGVCKYGDPECSALTAPHSEQETGGLCHRVAHALVLANGQNYAQFLLTADLRALLAHRAAQAAELERLRGALPDLSSVIGWLANGCSVEHAVTELHIYQDRIEAARALSNKGRRA